jgi:hypothetical protein
VANADWFVSRQRADGAIDAEGDEFYGLRGDATLTGHAVSVRMWAHSLIGDDRYLKSARESVRWLGERQDSQGGWSRDSVFTLDGAQCVFEGLDTYQRLSGDTSFHRNLERAASRMVRGTVREDGRLLLPNIIEIGEYAHFSLLAWKTTGHEGFRRAAALILSHIGANFDESEGFWCPFDRRAKLPAARRALAPALRLPFELFELRGRPVARLSQRLSRFAVGPIHPQYSMSLMDAEALLDTLDGSCSLPDLGRQTRSGVAWAMQHCPGPFPGTLVESRPTPRRQRVYPLKLINDTRMAATWPTTCLLLAYCGLNDPSFAADAEQTARWLVSAQDEAGGFFNFQRPDGSFHPLQSGNVNYYASMALWYFDRVYARGDLGAGSATAGSPGPRTDPPADARGGIPKPSTP